MEVMEVTVVGQELFEPVKRVLKLVELNPVNQVKRGMLGNLKALTYFVEIDEKEIIAKRCQLMDKLAENTATMLPLYLHGDWMKLYVVKPIRV